jgi:ABC-2 type transport system ATP-binding protein
MLMSHEVNTLNLRYEVNSLPIAIEVRALYKQYGNLVAVRDINFTVNKGELFGLIGPDGAGKTSTFHILGGVMEATSGDAWVFGQPARLADWKITWWLETARCIWRLGNARTGYFIP